MQIVIHAGGIPFDGDTINERSLGGSESAAYYVARELASRGHRVVVFTEKNEAGNNEAVDGVVYLWMGNRTQAQPMGENWHFYCEHTPHDVNIVQRQPGGLMFHIQSKINLWWAHDIALKRNNPAFMAQMWNTDRVMPVSNWFKDQITQAWLCDPDLITPVHNGVDYSLYQDRMLKENHLEPEFDSPITLLYQSRPERGLENLVREGGIMEQLLTRRPNVRLLVCGYEHPVPQLDHFYNYLRERIEELPNCIHLGQLSKAELARVQREEADIWCYPTEFEEVSCITAMEAMAAGMYVLTTNTAALPETLGDYENQTRMNYDENIVEKFVNWLAQFNNRFRRRPRFDYPWSRVVDEIEDVIQNCFSAYTADVDSVARHYLRNSDIAALNLMEGHEDIDKNIWDEVDSLYTPWMNDQEKYAEHYATGTERMYDGPDFKYEDESFVNHPRFTELVKYIKQKNPQRVLDYGCAHGMFTNYLAKIFPDVYFTGVDVSPAALKVAKEKSAEMGLENVQFIEDDWLIPCEPERDYVWNSDLVVLGEILEHVPDPVGFMDVVKEAVGNAHVFITTPIGPWESLSYEKDFPSRFHLHHFERSDLDDLFGHQSAFEVNCLPATHTEIGELLGWYITKFTFNNGEAAARPIDYDRKFRETRPYRQSVSLCMIVKDAEDSLLKTLRSVEPYVDEVVIGVDNTTTDRTKAVIQRFIDYCSEKHRSPELRFKLFDIPSPLEIGFDAARNLTLEFATKHWIMWCDSDEEFIGGPRLPKYLKQNGWKGYGIPQHHFSTEPLGVISTDYPVRLFRRDDDVRFRGVVHEHPENRNKPDDGVGFAYVLFELHFSHGGYGTEDIRRGRFMRNIGLMARDRETYPDRLLGKFLWIRDLALMCRFELEQTHTISPKMMHRAKEGLKLWEETIDKCSDHPQVRRMIKDHLEFYDTLVKMTGEGFTFRMNMASGPGTADIHLNGSGELVAQFMNRRHLDKFLSVVIDEEVKDYGTKYH